MKIICSFIENKWKCCCSFAGLQIQPGTDLIKAIWFWDINLGPNQQNIDEGYASKAFVPEWNEWSQFGNWGQTTNLTPRDPAWYLSNCAPVRFGGSANIGWVGIEKKNVSMDFFYIMQSVTLLLLSIDNIPSVVWLLCLLLFLSNLNSGDQYLFVMVASENIVAWAMFWDIEGNYPDWYFAIHGA